MGGFDTNDLYIRERERRRVRVLSVKDLLLSFCPSLRAHVNLLPVSSSLYPAFLRDFKEKIRVTNAIMLYMNDTLDEEDVLIMSWKIKTHLRGDDFSSKFPCQRAVDNEFLACVTCHRLIRMWTMTKQTNSYSPSFLC